MPFDSIHNVLFTHMEHGAETNHHAIHRMCLETFLSFLELSTSRMKREKEGENIPRKFRVIFVSSNLLQHNNKKSEIQWGKLMWDLFSYFDGKKFWAATGDFSLVKTHVKVHLSKKNLFRLQSTSESKPKKIQEHYEH